MLRMNFSPFYVKKGKGKIQVERKVKKNMEKGNNQLLSKPEAYNLIFFINVGIMLGKNKEKKSS